jgi:hypothetical protein
MLSTLFTIAALSLLVLIVRPQLVLRINKSAPSRKKLFIPFVACLILSAAFNHSKPHRNSGDDDNDIASNAQSNTAFRQVSCAGPECRLKQSVANATRILEAAQANESSSPSCPSMIESMQDTLSRSVDEMGGLYTAPEILDNQTQALRSACGV